MSVEAYLPSSPITTGLVALVAGLFSFWLLRRMRYNYPPRPGIALPLLGHAYSPMKTVVVNKIDEALEVLVKKSTDFANRLITPSVEMFTDGCRDIAFSNYSPTWKLHRKLSSKALRHVYKSPGFRKMEEFYKKVIVDFIGKKYHDEKKTFKRDELRHLVDHLILARTEAEESEGDALVALTDAHIIQTIADIFFAGVDTSRMTLRFALLHMAAYPDIQAIAQEEIDRVVGRDRLPGLSDRPDLAYTEAVLHESMRIATVAPTGVWHETLCDTSIGSYKIPKGTPVMINHWALHHDPDAWDEVEKFKPERYLDEHGKLGPKPKSWLPFGAGKRVCLGEFVAKPELHLIFASLLQRYRWSPEAGRIVDISPEKSPLSNTPKAQKLRMERRI
ncbi:CP17A-like protein [Mya arenaria]|uniref:CP17A-like protein n=1 Tax=Mya arenaria TaxID=6604 RepID=A0ABY7EXL7_MYAAR|nr:CP17A-like protein [Mya arenaria]